MTRKKQSYIKGTFSHRRTEADYMRILLDAVQLEDWRSVVAAALAAAKAGDASARTWLAHYLMGKPDATAPAAMTVVVQQLSGKDPLVEKLSRPHVYQLEYPEDRAEERPKDRIRALIADELRALEAQQGVALKTDANTEETGSLE